MADIAFEQITRTYPQTDRPAVAALDLHVRDGELLVLVGPSGCGKSTSLRMLAGLEPVDSGRIRIGDRDVTMVPAKSRDIAMVFQNYALYPHMTVAENMAFSLKMAKVRKPERARRVKEAAALLDLDGLLERRPRQLSGGQRQRVAMGRAIVREPQAFLMDEPLSNLDAQLRVQTRTQIAELQRRLAATTVYVTHDQVEAMTMGDRVAVLKDGVLQQCDTPLALYDRPVNAFVAGFIGSPAMNLLDVALADDGARLAGATIPLARTVLDAARRRRLDRITLGFRPEAAAPADDGLPMTVEVVEELGAEAFIYGRLDGAPGTPPIVVRIEGRGAPRRGSRIGIALAPVALHAFAAGDGARLD